MPASALTRHRLTRSRHSAARMLTGAVLVVVALLGTSACAGGGSTGSTRSADTPTADAAMSPAATPTTAWTTVSDPVTGVSVQLAGASVNETQAGITHKYVVTLPGGEQRLNLTQALMPPADGSTAVVPLLAQTVGGTLVSNQPVTVGTRPGADFQITFPNGAGQTGIVFGRQVYTSTMSVQLLTIAPASDEVGARALHVHAADSLRIP